MSKVKSFSVGDGDMFYIEHNTDNFTIIDCCLPEDEKVKKAILADIKSLKSQKGITRFISTHPDEDHIQGLKELDKTIDIVNFYCVENNAIKDEETTDFEHYCGLKNHQEKVFHIHKGCARKWMNQSCEKRNHSGIHILWPIMDNKHFKEALAKASAGESPNNLSPIIKYGVTDSATFLWMGDLETEFMKNILDEITLPKVNILFAPHHGRDSGKIPQDWLDAMNPNVIVIGEAPSEDLNYYQDYNTITQNSAGDITFIINNGGVDVYVGNEEYSVDFLENNYLDENDDGYYLGTLELGE
jgi:beta-lactamase superfamily II metal-dependent hydrolase